jgi:hypothetical protein
LNVLGGIGFEQAWRIAFWVIVVLAAIVVGANAVLS